MTTVTLNLEALLTRLERAGLLHLVGDGRVWDAAAAELRADYGDAVTVGLELPEPAVIEDEPGPWTYWLACSCPSCGHTWETEMFNVTLLRDGTASGFCGSNADYCPQCDDLPLHGELTRRRPVEAEA